MLAWKSSRRHTCLHDGHGACVRPVSAEECVSNNGVNTHIPLQHKVWVDFHKCVSLAGDNRERMGIVANTVKALKETLGGDPNSSTVQRGNHSVLENFCGSVPADQIVVRPPSCCTKQRLMRASKRSEGDCISFEKMR
nr:protein FAR1-RELATED SEQUENCE 5-like [Ipomoea trifida]